MQKVEIPEKYERRSEFLRRGRIGVLGEIDKLRHARRPLPQTRFVIFAQGRTGTGLLTHALDTHPEIRCAKELLSRPRVWPMAYVHNMARGSRAHCFGFHVKIYQLTAWQRVADPRDFIEELHARGWRLLHLYREDFLSHVVSNLFAQASGTYHFDTDAPSHRPEQIHVPVDRMVKLLDTRRRFLEDERAALARVPHLTLCYERDLLSPEAQARTFRRLQEWLEVPPADIAATLAKSVDKPLTDLVANFDDLVRALEGTRYRDLVAAHARAGP